MYIRVYCFLTLTLALSLALPYPSAQHHALQVLERLGFAKDTHGAQVTLGEGKRRGDSPIYYIKLPPLPYYYSQHNSIQSTPHPFQQVSVDFTSNGRPDQIYHWNLPSTTTSQFWPSASSFPSIPEVSDILNDPLPMLPELPSLQFSPIPATYPEEQNVGPNNIQYDVFTTSKRPTTQPPTSSTTTPPPIIVTTSLPLHKIPHKPTKHPLISNSIGGIPSKNPSDKKKPWFQIGKEKGMYVYNGKPNSIYIWRPKPQINPLKYKHPMFSHFNY